MNTKYSKVLILLLAVLTGPFVCAQAVGTPYLPNSEIPFSFLYGGSGDESMRNNIGSIEPTADGGYIIVGGSFSSASGDVSGTNHSTANKSDAWILKVDAVGKKQWEKLYGGNNEEYALAVKQTADGGYIVACNTKSSNSGNVTGTNHGASGQDDYWILKLNASGDLQWNKIYGGQYSDIPYDVLQTSDGGYIICGSSSSSANGDVTGTNHGAGGDIWLLKLNASGNKQWDKLYGGSNNEESPKMRPTSDGGYIIAASSSSSASGDVSQANHGSSLTWDTWILKLDASANKQWDKLYGGSGSEVPYSIRQTADNGYVIAASSNSSVSGNVTGTNNGGTDAWILKLDTSGNIQWNKLYGGTGTNSNDHAFDVQQTADGEYIVAGSNNINFSPITPFIVRLNSYGNMLWQQFYGQGYLISLKPTAGGYITGGFRNKPTEADKTNGINDLWIMKIDTSGNIVWVPDMGQ